MQTIPIYGTTTRLGQTRLGPDPKSADDSRSAHPRTAETKAPVRFIDWALI